MIPGNQVSKMTVLCFEKLQDVHDSAYLLTDCYLP